MLKVRESIIQTDMLKWKFAIHFHIIVGLESAGETLDSDVVLAANCALRMSGEVNGS